MLLGINKNIIHYLLYLLMCFQLMPFGVMSVSIILLSFVIIILNWNRFSLDNIKPVLFNTVFFLFMCLSLLYSSEKSEGINELQKGLSLLIIPFVFLLFNIKIDKKTFSKLKVIFVISNFIYVVYMYHVFVQKLSPYKVYGLRHENYIYKYFKMFFIEFDQILNKAVYVAYKPPVLFFHKGYCSMFLLLAIFFLIDSLFRNKTKTLVITNLKITLILFFCVVIIHWFSIPNVIALFVLVPLMLFYCIKSIKLKLGIFSLIILTTSVLAFKLSNNKSVINNLNQLKDYAASPFKIAENSLAGRSTINYCSIKSIDNHFIGFGIGSVKKNLVSCYEEENFETGFKNKLNSHNYFLHLYLLGGIILLVLFLSGLTYNFMIAFKSNDIVYICFLITFCLNSLTENTLFRIHGVLYFSLFNTLFLINNKNIIIK